MKKFFHAHPDVVIATLAVVFFAGFVACYLWAIGDIYAEVHQALNPPSPQKSSGFNLAAAAQIDLRGMTGATSSAPAAAPASATTALPIPPAPSSTP